MRGSINILSFRVVYTSLVIINTTETCSIACIKESLHSYVLNVPITSREGIEFINHNDGSTLRVSRKRRPVRTKVENQKISFFHVLESEITR